MRWFKAFYNGSLWAMAIALTCFHNTWIQMRINTGYIFYGSWLVLTILCYIATKKRETGILFSITSMILCIAYSYALYGWKRLQIVPASLLREGIHQPTIKFAIINKVIIAFMIIGIIIIILENIREKRDHKGRTL
ncbi:hypothetical protein [Muricomes intestini]|jgi:hypothetical protein|uniref:Uncharacterized protein n=1 Tax=Muricomes intestini TaxID=1796634 RepID=A0A4R3K544_9FIRM|nr:hypothetical protein [Muricomes intestini]TCS77893.1 hypothetical protein EDD59_11447 [Muricomes intestini]HAX52911.1 hypothetical protein [Lachnospiraceae bacterium]HCR81984.1 hypothetical protein [Lachnospiraceae bacterium]